MALSLYSEAKRSIDTLMQRAEGLGVKIHEEAGKTVIDCGVKTPGSLLAGKFFTEVQLGGQGRVNIQNQSYLGFPNIATVHTNLSNPVLATLGSQSVGINLKTPGYFAYVSGPGQAVSDNTNGILEKLAYQDRDAKELVFCLEGSQMPTKEAEEKLLQKTGIFDKSLVLLLTSLNSPAGLVQIAAKAVEMALFQLVELNSFFPNAVISAMGVTPLPRPSPISDVLMGITNDALLYGSFVRLDVNWPDDDALERLTKLIPSNSSPDYTAESFTKIFERADRDFNNLDLGLLGPARVQVVNYSTGSIFEAGEYKSEIVKEAIQG